MVIMYTIHNNDYYQAMETTMDDITEGLCLCSDRTVFDLYRSGALETLIVNYLSVLCPESNEYFIARIEVFLFESKSELDQYLIIEYGGIDMDREICCYDLSIADGCGQFWY